MPVIILSIHFMSVFNSLMYLMVSDSAATLPLLASMHTGTVPVRPEGLAAEESELEAGVAGTATPTLYLHCNNTNSHPDTTS